MTPSITGGAYRARLSEAEVMEGVLKKLGTLLRRWRGGLALIQGLRLFTHSGSTLRLAIRPPAFAAWTSQVFKLALVSWHPIGVIKTDRIRLA